MCVRVCVHVCVCVCARVCSCAQVHARVHVQCMCMNVCLHSALLMQILLPSKGLREKLRTDVEQPLKVISADRPAWSRMSKCSVYCWSSTLCSDDIAVTSFVGGYKLGVVNLSCSCCDDP